MNKLDFCIKSYSFFFSNKCDAIQQSDHTGGEIPGNAVSGGEAGVYIHKLLIRSRQITS